MTSKNLNKERIESLKQEIKRERKRINRIVEVLLNNLPSKNLRKKVNFNGVDCGGYYRNERMTLRAFLLEVLDP